MTEPHSPPFPGNTASPRLIQIGAIVCGVAVLLGAFGAHALEGNINDWYVAERAAKKLASWDTGVRYQLIHGLALLVLGLLWNLPGKKRILKATAIFFLAGVLIFSGGLYLWVLTDLRPFVIAVPLGGVSFVSGWLTLAFSTVAQNGAKEIGDPK